VYYIIIRERGKEVYMDGENKWHDLQEDKEDLPKKKGFLNVITEDNVLGMDVFADGKFCQHGNVRYWQYVKLPEGMDAENMPLC
jgi:hypothetical protein